MNQRGWKHFGVKTLPENTYYQKERETTQEYLGRSMRAKTLAVCFVIVAISCTLLYHPFFSITSVQVEGVHSVPTEVIRASVVATLQGYRWGFIPRRNIFFLDHGAIQSAVEEYFIPQSLKVTPEWGNVLSVQITEFPVVLYWKQGSNRYSINEQGYSTEQIPNKYTVPPGAVIVEDAGRTVTIGSQIVTREQVQWMLTAISTLNQQLHLQPISVVVSQTSPDIVELHLEHLELTLSYSDTPESQISRLKVLTDTKPTLLTDTTHHSVDLRFGEKVYYH